MGVYLETLDHGVYRVSESEVSFENEPVYRMVECRHDRFDETRFLGVPGIACNIGEKREVDENASYMHY